MKKALQKDVKFKFFESNRFLWILSFICAVVLWVGVTVGAGNVQSRTITVPVSVSLENTYASQIGLKLIKQPTIEVAVQVRGKWSSISKLTADDLQVRADVSSIQKAGSQEVKLIPSRNSANLDYDIGNCTPSSIMIECDYWKTASVELKIEAPSLTAKGEDGVQLGTPRTEATLKDNKVTISGPQTIVDKIDSLVARISDAEALTETRTFASELKAYDSEKEPVSLENCSFAEFDSTVIKVIVPLEISKEVTLGNNWIHEPRGWSRNNHKALIKPYTVTVVGPKDAMDALGDTLPVSSIDFDNLTNELYTWDIPLTTEDAIRVTDEIETVSVQLDLRGYSTKKISIPVSDSNVSITRNGKNMKTSIQEKTETITLVGFADDLDDITSEKITISVDIGNSDVAGTSAYTGRVVVDSTALVWAYYGATGTGLPVYVTLS